MGDSRISIQAVWADPDLIEIETSVVFSGWAGIERAYVTRDQLLDFASALDAVAAGANEATLIGGQRNLSYAEISIHEYDLARRLYADVRLGCVRDVEATTPRGANELQMAVPVERGQLAAFASGLRRIAVEDRGQATLAGLSDWP
jgi:hypothetical protein